jgi:UDP:flavonoid glycosyltransferase YjiC (YdhE family)
MKIVIITIPGFAHAVRCGNIAKYLQEKGASIICVGGQDSSFLDMSRKEGFECHSISFQMGPMKRYELPLYTEGAAISELRSLSELFYRIHPDLILSDGAPIVPLIAERLNVPHVSLVSAFWTNYYALERPILKWNTIGYFLGKNAQRVLRNYWTNYFNKKLSEWAESLNHVAISYDLTKRENLLSFLEGNSMTLVTDLPEIGTLKNAPKTFKYCGPLIWNPPFHSYDILRRLDKKKPAAYVSFGSSGAFFLIEKIVKWLLEEDWQVILTTAFNSTPLTESLIHDTRIITEEFINVDDVLPYCEAVIFHGGIGTAYQILMHKKPSVIIPRHFEQGWNAYRLEQLGVSRIMTPRLLTKERLITTLKEVIEKSKSIFQESTFFQQDRIKEIDGSQIASNLIYDLYTNSEEHK